MESDSQFWLEVTSVPWPSGDSMGEATVAGGEQPGRLRARQLPAGGGVELQKAGSLALAGEPGSLALPSPADWGTLIALVGNRPRLPFTPQASFRRPIACVWQGQEEMKDG